MEQKTDLIEIQPGVFVHPDALANLKPRQFDGQVKDVGNYWDIKWDTFKDFKLARFDTIGDGSCYFHAILNAFFLPYRTEKFNGHTVTKSNIVNSIRQDMAANLTEVRDGKTVYQTLSRGHLEEMSKVDGMQHLSLPFMIKHLASSSPVGNEYHEYVSNEFNKDIYMLDLDKKDVYILGDHDVLYKDRDSIVIIFTGGHYELVGLFNEDKSLTTLFKHDNKFITAIKARIQELQKKKNFVETKTSS